MALEVSDVTINMGDITGLPLRHYSVTVGMVNGGPNYHAYTYSIAAPNAKMASETAIRVSKDQFAGHGWKSFHVATIMDQGTIEVK